MPRASTSVVHPRGSSWTSPWLDIKSRVKSRGERGPTTMEARSLREYVREAALVGARRDCRSVHAYRDLQVVVDARGGAAEASAGSTRVHCELRSELVAPATTRPREGSLRIRASYASCCVSREEQESTLERLLQTSLLRSRALDAEALCVAAGRAAWRIEADVCVLSCDGNERDVANVALLASLMTLHLPEDHGAASVRLHHFPIAVTHAIVDRQVALVDPVQVEEEASTSLVTVLVESSGNVCGFVMLGRRAHPSMLERCALVAQARAEEVTTQLRETVRRWEDDRQKARVVRHTWDGDDGDEQGRVVMQTARRKHKNATSDAQTVQVET